MPDSEVLDLTAEDVTEAAWDELVHQMLGDELPFELTMSSPACSYSDSNCWCQTEFFP